MGDRKHICMLYICTHIKDRCNKYGRCGSEYVSKNKFRPAYISSTKGH